jgi:hypothetical protein
MQFAREHAAAASPRVHLVTLITGEYSDTTRQVVGAYLDYAKASARKAELEDLFALHGLDKESVRNRLRADGEYTVPGAEEAFTKDAGLGYVYMSYNGFHVDLSSYHLNG